MPSQSVHVHSNFHLVNVHSKHDIVVGIFQIRNNHFLKNQMFSDHVASLHQNIRFGSFDAANSVDVTTVQFDPH